MPRTDLTAGIEGQLDAPGAYPGHLVEITTVGGQVVRLTSIDAGFTWDGHGWLASDLQVLGLSWDGTLARNAKLIIGDADLSFWVLALALELVDARVRIWGVYADVLNEAAPLFFGKIGMPTRNGLTVEMDLDNSVDTITSPRERVQHVVNPVFLLPAGTIININGQRWIIARPTSAAG